MDMELTLADIRRLPKTDLHVHLDGSLRLSTMLELAETQGIALPADTPEGLSKALHCGEHAGSLVEYLKAFDTTLAVLQTEDALFQVAYELAEDAAAENVRYIEVRYSPMLHTRGGLRLTTVVEAVLAGDEHRQDRLFSTSERAGLRLVSLYGTLSTQASAGNASPFGNQRCTRCGPAL